MRLAHQGLRKQVISRVPCMITDIEEELATMEPNWSRISDDKVANIETLDGHKKTIIMWQL